MRDSSPPGDVRRGPATVDTDSTTSPSPSDPDRRQVSRRTTPSPCPAVSQPHHPPAQRLVEDRGGVGVDKASFAVATAGRLAPLPVRPPAGRDRTGGRAGVPRAPDRPPSRPTPGPATPDTPIGRARQVVDPGRRAVIQIAEPREVRCPRSSRQTWSPALVTNSSRSFATAVTKSNGATTMWRMLNRCRKSPGRRCPIEPGAFVEKVGSGPSGPPVNEGLEMALYLIAFNDEWVPDLTMDEIRARGVAGRAVIEEITAAGEFVFSDGGLTPRRSCAASTRAAARRCSPTGRFAADT